MFAAIGPVLCAPPVATGPFQPPVAAHAVALVEFQVSVAAPPLATLVGLAVNVAVGTAATATVVVAGAVVPPAPVQVSEYDVLAVIGPVPCVPELANVPVQPSDAVQDVALVEFHVNMDVLPLATAGGVAVNETVGTGGVGGGTTLTFTATDAVALVPPKPAQANENIVFAVSAPMLCVPLLASAPLQPPVAMHDVASVELQASVTAFPLSMVVGDALSDAMGNGFAAFSTGLIAVGPTVLPQAVNHNAAAMVTAKFKQRMSSLRFPRNRIALLAAALANFFFKSQYVTRSA